jgi:hypothetical protein
MYSLHLYKSLKVKYIYSNNKHYSGHSASLYYHFDRVGVRFRTFARRGDEGRARPHPAGRTATERGQLVDEQLGSIASQDPVVN